jgi:hypothetical protein
MPYFAETEFVLSDQDISGIVLQFERGVAVTGRIVPPAGAVAGAVANVRLGATPVDSYAALVPARVIATTRPNGTFVFDGVGPGKWRVTAPSLPAGWSLRSAVLGERDTLDVPFEVRLGPTDCGPHGHHDGPADRTDGHGDSTRRVVPRRTAQCWRSPLIVRCGRHPRGA